MPGNLMLMAAHLVGAAGFTSARSHIPSSAPCLGSRSCSATASFAESAAVASRRSVLATAAAALLSPAVAANAYDLPPPTEMTDPVALKKYAAMGNPDKKQQQGSAFIAITNGDMPTLQAMADNGWALGELADDAGKTVLHRAATLGNEPALKLLLKAGSPIDAYTSFNETPLHLAVRNNRLGCVKLLVDAGASTSAEYGKNGDTALSLAQKYKFEPIIDYLKSKGAPGAVAGSKAADTEIDRGAPGFLPSLPCPKVLKAYLCN
uniref:Uncharacterized protein n=1 Tax=Phaeocystis antarctica TaxID=33657 RepID=A0A7S0HXF8_9EUKA